MINKSHSKMDEIVPPVVTAKPVRGREMVTKTVPTDVFESMRLMSVKKASKGESLNPEIQKPREGNAEIYHEGYVDGKLFLVPDSNLEAMKDIVNFKMRPRRSIRYKHQTSYEISDYDHFRSKLSHLLDKLDHIPPDDHTEPIKEEEKADEEEKTEEEEKVEEEEKEGRQINKKDQITGESEEEEEEEEEKPHGMIKDQSAGESEEDEEEEEELNTRIKDQSAGESEEDEEDEKKHSMLKDHSADRSDEEEEEDSFLKEEPIEREKFVLIKGEPMSEYEEGTETDGRSETETESESDSEVEHDTKPNGVRKSEYPGNKYVDIKEGTETENIVESETESEAEHGAESMEEHKNKPKGVSKSDYPGNNYVDIEEGTETGNIVESETESGSNVEYGTKPYLKSIEDKSEPGEIPKHKRTPKSSKEKHKGHLESDRSYVRFLISGHFKKGKKPIYIIQEYNGDSLFKNQNTDIFTSEKNGDIDILIAGKYYNENILEETNGKPIALNTKPNKIMIDENMSRVYEQYFEDVFYMKTADIFVKGKFLTNEITKKVTPFIRFGIKRKVPID